MKNLITVSGILSWINLVIGSFLVLAALLLVMMSPNIIVALLSMMLMVAIVLHSYAALQLRKSILHPEIPLGHNTPTGIKFMGFVALFFAINNIVQAVALLSNPGLVIENIQSQMPKELQGYDLRGMLRFVGVVILTFGISIAVNVLINMNLLRWFQRQKDEA